jgi:type VI secretion system protein ImpA
MLDLEGLLQPVAEGAPSGADLKYTAEYGDLERAVEGKPERQAGGTIVPAEPPEWKSVLEKGQALLKTSKDLRVAVILVRALLEIEGFSGFAEGLALVRGIVERYWDTFHPQLDAEDGNDPTARVSVMAELTHRNMIQVVRAAPLVVSRAFGPVSLRTLEALTSAPKAPAAAKPAPAAAKGGAPAPAAPPPLTAAAVEAAFREVSLDTLVATVAVLAGCVDDARKLAEGWGSRLEGMGPDFGELRKLLAQALQAVKSRADARQAAEAGAAAAGGAGGASDGAAAEAFGAPTAIRGDVLSRDDVLRAIDSICAYYARNEPSSPVPLLLQRSKRLVTMSFMDILKDMLPESVANVQKITGKTE